MSRSPSQLSTARATISLENRISQPQSKISTEEADDETRNDSVKQHVPNRIQETEEEEEEETSKKPEPNVSSLDPDERKLARRLRILRRNEAIRKAAQIADGVQIEEGESLKTRLESEVENSSKELERLLLEGRELVTNVRVANDSREVARRLIEAEKHESRKKRLEEDVEITKSMYEEVEKKWKELSSSSDPMDLKTEIDAQKEKCDILLARKDEVIKQLMVEVEEADVRFVRDQAKQRRDIAILVQRIESHVKFMKECYRKELQLIEDTIAAEKKELVDTATESWGKLYEEREAEETINLNKRFEDIEDQDNEIQKIRTEHREKYRSTKIQLETDLQAMEKEMEQIKFQCFLNSEKLDFNYQILQKREEENIMIRAQQKRRLNKLQDTLTNLRRRIRLGKEAASNEAMRLNDEVIRLHDSILSIERKADYFANIHDRRYHKVWDMNEETARELLDRIYTIDKIIHEQQLGYEWKKPDTNIPCKTDLPSFHSAMQAVSELFKDPEENIGGSKHSSEVALEADKTANEIQGKLVRQRLLKHILQRIADASGFLVEDRLTKLLEPYSKCQKTIVLLDNVFDALGLRYEADIELLREYFLPYAVCTECQPPAAADANESTDGSDPSPMYPCPVEHDAFSPEPCEESDELSPPQPKPSFDSEEISGLCPSSRDVGIPQLEDEVECRASESLAAHPREVSSPSGRCSEETPFGSEQAPMSESDLQEPGQAPLATSSAPLRTGSAPPGCRRSSRLPDSKSPARESAAGFRKCELVAALNKLGALHLFRSSSAPSKMKSESTKGESSLPGSTTPQTSQSVLKAQSSISKTGSAPPQETGSTSPKSCRCSLKRPSSSLKIGEAPSKKTSTGSPPSRSRSTTSQGCRCTPKRGSSPSKIGEAPSKRTSSGSPPSRSRSATSQDCRCTPKRGSSPSKTGSASPRSGSHRQGISSPRTNANMPSSEEQAQNVRSQSVLEASMPQHVTADGTFCIEFNAIVTIDIRHHPSDSLPAVPSLPKYPAPPAQECIESHTLEIQPIYVYMALNDFVSKFRNNELSDIKSIAKILSRKRNTVSRMISPDDVSNFWKSYQTAFPAARRKMWEGFQKGVNKYYEALSLRHKLNMEAMALQRQNEELKTLLANYVKNNKHASASCEGSTRPTHISEIQLVAMNFKKINYQ